MLYSRNGKVYVTARSQEKANDAIKDIKAAVPKSMGDLVPLVLDLADLGSIKASAERFLSAESRLDVLFNNAGYMGPAKGLERTAQGYEMHLGVNCVGPFLFTKFLIPTLVATAKNEPTPKAVRVIFLTSFAAEIFAEKHVGINMNNLDYHIDKRSNYRYGISKAGDWAYAVELSKHFKADGVIGLGVNPGNLRSELFRHQSAVFKLLTGPFNYPVLDGAYTELWAGVSSGAIAEKAESYVIPFGRSLPIRPDLAAAARSEAEGGNATTQKFWEWSEKQVAKYL